MISPLRRSEASARAAVARSCAFSFVDRLLQRRGEQRGLRAGSARVRAWRRRPRRKSGAARTPGPRRAPRRARSGRGACMPTRSGALEKAQIPAKKLRTDRRRQRGADREEAAERQRRISCSPRRAAIRPTPTHAAEQRRHHQRARTIFQPRNAPIIASIFGSPMPSAFLVPPSFPRERHGIEDAAAGQRSR